MHASSFFQRLPYRQWACGFVTREDQLGIICIEMLPHVMHIGNVTTWQSIYDKGDWAEDGALRESAVKGMGVRPVARYIDTLCAVRQVGLEMTNNSEEPPTGYPISLKHEHLI